MIQVDATDLLRCPHHDNKGYPCVMALGRWDKPCDDCPDPEVFHETKRSKPRSELISDFYRRSEALETYKSEQRGQG